MADPDPHLLNSLAVVALGVTTDMTTAIEAATGLSMKEVAALTTLANWADGRSIEVLRTVLDMSQPGCARLVDRLTDEGLAARGRDSRDRRVMTVRITPAGRRVVAASQRARAQATERWLTGLPAAQANALGKLLDRISEERVRTDGNPVDAMNSYCRLCDPMACGFPERCATTAGERRHRAD